MSDTAGHSSDGACDAVEMQFHEADILVCAIDGDARETMGVLPVKNQPFASRRGAGKSGCAGNREISRSAIAGAAIREGEVPHRDTKFLLQLLAAVPQLRECVGRGKPRDSRVRGGMRADFDQGVLGKRVEHLPRNSMFPMQRLFVHDIILMEVGTKYKKDGHFAVLFERRERMHYFFGEFTLIVLGLASSALGICSVSIPFSMCTSALEASSISDRVTVRKNLPLGRSWSI